MLTTLDHDSIRELRLARPPANALSPELVTALAAAIEQAPRDGVRAIVLSGAPGMFCGGLDVPLLMGFDRSNIRTLWEDLYGMLRGLAAARVPVAAAVTGHSPAGGAVIASYCDYRVMAEGDYKIGFNEVRVGIPMPVAILRCVARVIGDLRAERLCVSGALLSPAEAQRLGLVDELAPADQVVERAVSWCRSIVGLPPVAMARTRDASRGALVRLMDEGLAGELDQLVENWFHPEAQSELRAVVEKLAQKRKV